MLTFGNCLKDSSRLDPSKEIIMTAIRSKLPTSLRQCILILLAVSLANIPSLHAQTIQGYMPDESETHEGTWLQWPHSFTYGTTYRDRLTPTWIAMTRALVAHERVHIIVYNGSEKSRVQGLLTTAGISLRALT